MLTGRLMSREPLAVAVSSLPSALRTLSGLYGTVDSAPRSLEGRLEPPVGAPVQALKRHANSLHTRLSELHARFAAQPALASGMSPEEWQLAWQQQVKHLSAAQSVLRHKEPARLGAAKEAAAALSAVEAATGRLETSLSDV
ncbi:hypothetical protein ABPG77_006897 [Micractinium sp. CCAP 211/92]